MTLLSMRAAVLYLRLSVSDDASTSIARQEADLRALAEREGWEVVRVLTDDGISGRRARANVAEALRMLREGEADVLAVWKLDRLTRQGLSAIGDLSDTLDKAPGTLFVALQDGLRSDQASWRLIAAVLSEIARTEADNTALRVRSSIASRRQEGRFTGGIPGYGYRPGPSPDGVGRVLFPDPAEVAVIREAVDRILHGQSLSEVAADFTRRRIPTTRSPARVAQLNHRPSEGLDPGRWTTTSLQIVLTSHHLLGRIIHNGQPIIGPNGRPLQPWDPIVDLPTMNELRARLLDPRQVRAGRRQRRVRASLLLSGVVFCSDCGERMYLNTVGRAKYPVYTCSGRGPDRAVRPRVSMMADHVERYVAESFLALAGDAPEYDYVGEVDPETEEALAEIEEALRQTTGALLADGADTAALLARLENLTSRRTVLKTQPASRHLEPTGRTLREAWDATDDFEERRNLLLTEIDHVLITPASPGANRRRGYHPERISIVWYS